MTHVSGQTVAVHALLSLEFPRTVQQRVVSHLSKDADAPRRSSQTESV
jgi:hypothetical protein